MIREAGASLGRTVLDGVGRVVGRLQEHKSLSADLLESDDAYLAVFDAPGAEATDVSVRFEDDTLLVHIDRFREFYDGYEMVFPGRGLSLDGAVTLGPDTTVDADRAEATITQHGTLEVLIPKGGIDVVEKDDETVAESTTVTGFDDKKAGEGADEQAVAEGADTEEADGEPAESAGSPDTSSTR